MSQSSQASPINLKQFDRAWKKSVTVESTKEKLQLGLAEAIDIWEGRTYQPGEWYETNIKHRDAQIETLTSLLKQLNDKGYLTANQKELADKLIRNARSLEGAPIRCKVNINSNSSNNNSETSIPTSSDQSQPAEKGISMSSIHVTSEASAKNDAPVPPTQPVAPSQSTSPAAPAKTNGAAKPPTAPNGSKKIISLPTKKSVPTVDLFPNTILFYGPNGCGKSPFWADCPNALYLMCEPGAKGLSIWKMPEDAHCFSSWEEFTEACRLLLKSPHTFSPIIIDSVTGLIDLARPYALGPYGVKHESELDYGKGTAAINNVIGPVIKTLSRANFGLVLIAHAKQETVKTRTGEIKRTSILLPESSRQLFMDISDLILCMQVVDIKQKDNKVKPQRVIYAAESSTRLARDRHGRLPAAILAEPKGAGYQKLLEAWHAGGSSSQPPIDPIDETNDSESLNA